MLRAHSQNRRVGRTGPSAAPVCAAPPTRARWLGRPMPAEVHPPIVPYCHRPPITPSPPPLGRTLPSAAACCTTPSTQASTASWG